MKQVAPSHPLGAQVAEGLLHIRAVGFSLDNPIQFKSGILSPVYVDNRVLPSHPEEWGIVIRGFASLLKEDQVVFDYIAGVETAGIPHSAALGFNLERPSVFVRKQPKEHGKKKRVEGGDVVGKRVVLLEDLITTGGSSLSGVEALRAEGAQVSDCIAIVSYGFTEATEAFSQAKVRLHTLTTFPTILDVAVAQNLISEVEHGVVSTWLSDPWAWTKQHQS